MSYPLTVVGCGYTGGRILKRVPSARGITRTLRPGLDASRVQLIDLDADVPPLAIKGSVVITVAPDDGERMQRLLSALDPTPSRIVYLSTTGVYGDRRGEQVLEADPVNPMTERAKRRVAAEILLQDLATDSELVILRVPGIYGPERLGLTRLRERSAMLREKDATPGNRIHVEDLVSICIRAAEVDAPTGIFNVGDGDHRSATWFSGEVARQAGLPTPEEVTLEVARKTFSPRRLSFLEESRRIDTSKLESFGLRLRYADPTDGIRASLAADD